MQTLQDDSGEILSGHGSTALAIRYVDHLAAIILANGGRTKGEERRLGLLLAAAEILQQGGGYHDLSIADVIGRAGVARGTFYIYFRDKSDIVLSVLTDFRRTMLTTSNVDMRGQSWESRVFHSNLYFAKLHEHNAGLMQTFRQLVEEEPEFRRMRHQTERVWAGRQFSAWMRRFGKPENFEAKQDIFRQLHALRAMIEHLCAQVFIEQMPELVALYPTPSHVAQTCSKIWISTLSRNAENS